MTHGVGQAPAPASPRQKAQASHGGSKKDAVGFGKALQDDGKGGGRKLPEKAEGATTASTRWTSMTERLSATLDAAAKDAPAGREATPQGAPPNATQPELPQTASGTILKIDTLPEEASAGVDEDALPPPTPRAAAPRSPTPAARAPVLERLDQQFPVAENADQPGGADPLAELLRALTPATERTDDTSAVEPDADAPDATADEDKTAQPVEAPRMRFPEPLIYLASMVPLQRQAANMAGKEDGQATPEASPPPIPANRNDSSGKEPASAASAAPVVQAMTGAASAVAAPPAARRNGAGSEARTEPAVAPEHRPEADPPTSTAADTAKPQSRSPDTRPAPASAAPPPTATAQPAIAPAGDSAPGARSAAGEQDTGSGAGASRPSVSTDPRRAEPSAPAKGVTVAAEHAFAAPAVPIVNPTVAGLTDAIAGSQPVPRPVPVNLPVHAGEARGTQTLQIQLNPLELGMVTAHLKVAGSQLSVELQVDNSEAYHRLTRDGDAIVASLRKHGYDIDTVTVLQPQAAIVAQARTDATNPTANSAARDGAQMASGESGSGGQGASGQSAGRQGNGNFEGRESHAQTAPGRAGSGIFI